MGHSRYSDQVFNIDVPVCVLNIFVIALIPSFSLRFIPGDIKSFRLEKSAEFEYLSKNLKFQGYRNRLGLGPYRSYSALNGTNYQIIAPVWLTIGCIPATDRKAWTFGPLGARLETCQRAVLASQTLLLQILELTRKQHGYQANVAMLPSPSQPPTGPNASSEASEKNTGLTDGTAWVNTNHSNNQTSTRETSYGCLPRHWASKVWKVSNPSISRNKRGHLLADAGTDTMNWNFSSQPTILEGLCINIASGWPRKHPRVASIQANKPKGSWPLNLTRATRPPPSKYLEFRMTPPTPPAHG
ncbi:hypothetical protein PIB30_051545 [Stylosanthes scabra]|uniref:Uncharacterized protein n=1 Tax=Stylosanthes scabra TaxID=79078 RepID=A0ABU6WGG2_9FABA|nr:hypothetical protein [Stylosanthes scabra]